MPYLPMTLTNKTLEKQHSNNLRIILAIVGIGIATTIGGSMSVEQAYANTSPDWLLCASEGNLCNFVGEKLVKYGKDNTWTYGTFTDGVDCSNIIFGDPSTWNNQRMSFRWNRSIKCVTLCIRR